MRPAGSKSTIGPEDVVAACGSPGFIVVTYWSTWDESTPAFKKLFNSNVYASSVNKMTDQMDSQHLLQVSVWLSNQWHHSSAATPLPIQSGLRFRSLENTKDTRKVVLIHVNADDVAPWNGYMDGLECLGKLTNQRGWETNDAIMIFQLQRIDPNRTSSQSTICIERMICCKLHVVNPKTSNLESAANCSKKPFVCF